METSFNTERPAAKSLLSLNRTQIVLLGLAVIIPAFVLGAVFGEDFIPSNSQNLSAKAAPSASITAVEVSEITNSTAVVRWETKSAGDAQVDYGTSTMHEFVSELDSRPDTSHEIALVNLEPGQEYHLKARSKSPNGRLYFSADKTFTTLQSQRGQVSICGWDGDSIERADTVCSTNDGWAKGESWTESCTAVWTQTTSTPVEECIYQFTDVKAIGSVSKDELWQVEIEPTYTGWVDVMEVSDPSGEFSFLPAAQQAQNGVVQMGALSEAGKYSFRFRPADDGASWSDVLTITVRK